jgi:hypothetical protein
MEKLLGGILLFSACVPAYAGSCAAEVGTGTFSIGSLSANMEEKVLESRFVSGQIFVRTKSQPKYIALDCAVSRSWHVRLGYVEGMSVETKLDARIEYRARGLDFTFGRVAEISGPQVSLQRVVRFGDVEAGLGLGVMRATGVLEGYLDTKYLGIRYTEVRKHNLPFVDLSLGYSLSPRLGAVMRHERFAPQVYNNLFAVSYRF